MSTAEKHPTQESRTSGDTIPNSIIPGCAETIAVLGYSLSFAFATGYRNGELDQVLYLLDGLRRADPSFLAGDWYASSVPAYHTVWGLFIATTERSGSLAVSLAIGTVLVSFATAIGLYFALRAILAQPLLPWASALLLFNALFSRGIGMSQLLPAGLEASSIAGAATVLGLALMAWNRPFLAGTLWGFAGLIHAHFAVLLLVVLIGASAALRHRVPHRYIVSLWLPFILISAYSFGAIATEAGSSRGKQALEILGTVAPQHYYPWRYSWRPFALFSGAILMGIVGILVRPPVRNPRLSVPILVCLLIVVCGLILGTADTFWFINRIWPWRLSHLVILAGIALGCSPMGWRRDKPLSGPITLIVVTALFVASALLGLSGTPRLHFAIMAVASAAVVDALLRRAPTRVKRWPCRSAGPFSLLFLSLTVVAYREEQRSHLAFRPAATDRAALYSWVRTTTSPGSIFVIPPAWDDFRLNAQRGLIADWWAPPLSALYVLQWYQRMQDLYGIVNLKTFEQIQTAFDHGLDCHHIAMLTRRYGATHLVLPQAQLLRCGPIAYQDSMYVVEDISQGRVQGSPAEIH